MKKISHSVQVVKNGLKVLAGQIGLSLFMVGFGVYFAHALTLKEMGIIVFAGLITTIIPVISMLGMNDILIKKIPALIEVSDNSLAKKYIIHSIYIQFILLAIIFLVILLLNRQISILFYKECLPFNTIVLVASNAIFTSMSQMFVTILRAVQKFGILSIINIISSVFQSILSLLLFFILHINGIFIGQLVGILISLIMAILFLKKYLVFSKPSFNFSKKFISESFPFYSASWLRFLIVRSDRYFIGIFFQPEQLAIYHIAKKIIEYYQRASYALADPITSKLSQLKVYGVERMKEIYRKICRYYILIYIPLCAMIVAFAKPFVILYGGEKYIQSAQILIILAIAFVLGPFAGLYEILVFLIGKSYDRFKLRLLSGIFSLIGSYCLMILFAVDGLALSRILVNISYLAAGIMLLKKYIKVNFDYKEFDRIRWIRNGINYYGTEVDFDQGKELIKKMFEMKKKLVNKYLKKL